MTFMHPTHPLRRVNPELLIVLVITCLLMLALLVINLLNHLPRERTVPAPVIAAPHNVPVHFSKVQGSVSVTEASSRPLPEHLNASLLKSSLQALLSGPTPAEKEIGYYSEIPKGTRLLGVSANHNTVKINLSKEFTQGGGSTSMLQRVQELKDTVTAVAGSRTIQLAVEGKPLQVLGGEGLELN